MTDRIELELKGARVKEIITPVCCYKICSEPPAGMLALRYPDGRSNIYVLCRPHLTELRARHTSTLGRNIERQQGAFYY